MTRYTLKQLKSLVRQGLAIDITHEYTRAIPGAYYKVGYSSGVYGCNGLLLRDYRGQLYAITARTTAIFLY